MRINRVLAGVVAAGLVAFPAMAQDGQYATQLTRILEEAAAGTCLAALMAPPLLDACNVRSRECLPLCAAWAPSRR